MVYDVYKTEMTASIDEGFRSFETGCWRGGM